MEFYRNKETLTEFIRIGNTALQDGLGMYFGIKTNIQVVLRDDLMEPISFHEAFRNEVNKIVMDAITNQHKESLYDHTGRNSLAVSDMQKKWILDHFVHKHDLDKGFLEFVKLSEAHSVLILEYKDLQNKFVELQKENYSLGKELRLAEDQLNGYVYQSKNQNEENQDHENPRLKQQIMELTQKLIDQQREYDQRFADLYDSKKKVEHVHNDSIWYIDELKKFILHLQDYIAAKHLESEGLILEKFIQEESDGRKEST